MLPTVRPVHAEHCLPLRVHRNPPPLMTTAIDNWLPDPSASQTGQRAALPSVSNLELGPAAVLSLQTTLLAHDRHAAAAAALATEMASMLGCERVCIGLTRHGGARLEAVSHGISERPAGTSFQAVTAAMDECIDQGISIPFPPQGRACITLAHAELSKRNGGIPLLSLPLVRAQQVIGAITLEGKSFAPEEIDRLEHVVSLLAPLLDLKRQSDLPLSHHLLRVAIGYLRKLTGPGHYTLKAASLGTLIFTLFVTLLPADHRITAPARLEGQVQRILSAPSEGYLKAVHARPGDRVSAGQILVELAQQDLLLELRRWQSELAQHENAYGAAMSSGNRTELAISLGRMREAQSRCALIEAQLKRSSIEAPFDGVVISGELSQSLGMPVERGQSLMTVAPSQHRRLIIEVDSRDIVYLRPGQIGEFALQSLPGKALDLRVRRITSVASNHQGRNFFAVEADILGNDGDLRPGLEGIAKVVVGRETRAWLWTHRATDWLRLQLWRWLG